MSENRDYYTNREDYGTINISEDVLASIASLAAAEVEGIAGLYSPSGVDLAELLGKKSLNKGVKIQIIGKSVIADINVNIKYGYKIPEVAGKLQDAVVSAIESMTGLTVDSVNVHVGGVSFDVKAEEN
jgi:uncharacterized alkaline shock family protein YloU